MKRCSKPTTPLNAPHPRHITRLLLLPLLTALGGLLQAANVSFVWDPNTETDLAGYRFYYGTPPGNYTNVADVGNVTNHVTADLTAGETYSFYVTAYNASGLESEPSNVVTIAVPIVDGLQLSRMSLTPEGLEFQWNATEGRNYQILYKDDLNVPDWQELAIVTAPGVTAAFRPDYENPSWRNRQGRFFRIVEMP